MDDFGQIVETLKDSFRSFGAEFTSVWFFIQIGMLLFAAGAAYASAAWMRKHIQLKSVMTGWPPFVRQLVFATYHIFPFIVFALLTAFLEATLNATSLSARSSLLHIATSLATAWIVISLLAGLLRNQFVNRIAAISAWTIAALSILGLLDNMTTMLDRQSFTIGDLRISLLVVLKTTRYTLVTLRDGREVLVPNEDLVTQRVVNWSHTNDQVRLEVQFGVSYASDPHAVQKIALAAVAGMPRVLSTPNTTCVLAKFGDSSLDFKLRFWIGDPINGIGNIRSEVMFALWDAFKREGIEIPYPVRDVRVSNAAGDPTPRISA